MKAKDFILILTTLAAIIGILFITTRCATTPVIKEKRTKVPSNFLALKHKNFSNVVPLPEGINGNIYTPCPKDFALGGNVHCLVYYMVRVYVVEVFVGGKMVGFEAILLDVESMAGNIRYYRTYYYDPWIEEIDEKEFWRILNDYIYRR